MLRITDKRFHYIPSYDTDLNKRFKKIIRDQRAAVEAAVKAAGAPAKNSVVPMARRASTQG